jgi:glycosyltransferase involved in cell wall biosynthesis
VIRSLALNMVVFNESHRIADTLAKALPLVDEAVIVDQSSTDDTALIAKEMGATVISDVHHGFCEPSRQMAMDATAADWILLLDADEECTEPFIAEMRDLDRHLQIRLRIGQRVAGEVFMVGRSVFRLFKRREFYHLPKIHSCPLPGEPLTPSTGSWLLPYIAIWDEKSWTELLDGFESYERLGRLDGIDLLFRAREQGLDGPALDSMTTEERHALGFHPKQSDLDIITRAGLWA